MGSHLKVGFDFNHICLSEPIIKSTWAFKWSKIIQILLGCLSLIRLIDTIQIVLYSLTGVCRRSSLGCRRLLIWFGGDVSLIKGFCWSGSNRETAFDWSRLDSMRLDVVVDVSVSRIVRSFNWFDSGCPLAVRPNNWRLGYLPRRPWFDLIRFGNAPILRLWFSSVDRLIKLF